MNRVLLMVIASNIQDRLKTDEYARISINRVLSICRILPNAIDNSKNGQIILLTWYRRMNIGANFCHVIRTKALAMLEFFVILTNHSWNGEAAIFTIRDIRGRKTISMIVIFGEFEIVMLLTNKTEDTDWITKYFILNSDDFDFGEFFRIEQ